MTQLKLVNNLNFFNLFIFIKCAIFKSHDDWFQRKKEQACLFLVIKTFKQRLTNDILGLIGKKHRKLPHTE